MKIDVLFEIRKKEKKNMKWTMSFALTFRAAAASPRMQSRSIVSEAAVIMPQSH